MKNGKLRIWLGIFLLLAQLLSLAIMNTCGMVLWDTNAIVDEDAYEPSVSEGLDTILFGMYVGYHKMEKTFLEELPEDMGIIEENDTASDLTSENSSQNTTEDLLRTNYAYSAIEEISMDIRHELYNAQSHNFLDIYDLFIVIGYLLPGILGLILVISGSVAKSKWDSTFMPEYYVDAQVGFPSTGFHFPAALLCIICRVIQLTGIFSFSLIMQLFPILLLTIFFLSAYGRKPSTLPAGAMVAWAVAYLLRIWNATMSLFLYVFDDAEILYYILFILVGMVCGSLYFIAGIKLYNNGNKDDIKTLTLWGGIIAIPFALFGPVIYGVTDFDIYLESIGWADMIFTILLVVYVWFIFPVIPLHESLAEPERPCPTCGAPVGVGRVTCARCGSEMPSAAPAPKPEPAPAPAPAPEPEPATTFCPNCGHKLEPGQPFCAHCGQKTS